MRLICSNERKREVRTEEGVFVVMRRRIGGIGMRGNVANVVPQEMGVVVEEVGLCFHSGHTTCILSSFRVLTPTPMPMPMPTTTWASTTTSTRYRLPGTLIASPLPAIISRIITATITIIITRIIITIIVTIITIITITTTTTTRFKSIPNSPEISIIETPVSVCKVILIARTLKITEWKFKKNVACQAPHYRRSV